ncbi:MAG: PQQ-binding-like beta-propeller repeat protein [Desulfobacteraceae bacterium]|nr:PQQ-binding-like beta-propeller repeat protein [Desulfobacteraceae bacterium]
MTRAWITAVLLIFLSAPAGFAASFNFSASEQYLIKGESVEFTFTCELSAGEQAQSLTIELDYDNDGETDHSISFDSTAGSVVRQHSVVFDAAGYFDAEAEFSLTYPDGQTRTESLGPLRIHVANWKFEAGGCIASTPAVSPDGGTLYFGSADHYLYAVNTGDGTKRWQKYLGGDVDSSPAVDSNGYVYVGTGEGHVYCLSPQGYIEWQFPAGSGGAGGFFSSPALDEERNRLYIGSTNGYLYALNTANRGNIEWKYKTGSKIVSSPAVGFDHTIYICSLDTFLYALNPDGSLKWRFDAKSQIRGSPALDRDGTIYFGTSLFRGEANADNGLYAISTAGQKKWFAQNRNGLTSAPVIDDDSGTVVVSSWGNRIFGISRSGGGLGMYKTYEDDVLSGPALGSRNYLFAGARDGVFYAMDIERGNMRTGRKKFWKYRLPRPVAGSSPVIHNGYVYVGTCENDGEEGSGALYSFRANEDPDRSDMKPDEDSPWPQFRKNSQNTGMTALRPDTVAPAVVLADPAPGVREFNIDRRSISVTFSMPMDPASIYQPQDPSSDFEGFFGFTVEPFDPPPEDFTIDWNAAHTEFTLTLPDGVSFEAETEYTATINSKAREEIPNTEDGEDRHILYDYKWSFRHDPEESHDNSHNQFSCFISAVTSKNPLHLLSDLW